MNPYLAALLALISMFFLILGVSCIFTAIRTTNLNFLLPAGINILISFSGVYMLLVKL